VALVKIRQPQLLDNTIVEGIGKTLAQLERLGLISVVVVDCETGRNVDIVDVAKRRIEQQQAVRLISAIEDSGASRARLVDNVVGVNDMDSPTRSQILDTSIIHPDLLLTPLRKGIIPVLPSLGYTSSQRLVRVPASRIVKALTRELAGHVTVASPDEDPFKLQEQLARLHGEIALDKLIILDPLGGIPASRQENGYHVFLNMEQEFEGARQDLTGAASRASVSLSSRPEMADEVSDIAASNPISTFIESEFGIVPITPPTHEVAVEATSNGSSQHHLDNLKLARSFLARLPPSASVLITSPGEAANLSRDDPFQAGVVGTRRQRNPLIHNLLTDRPAFSSSLPAGRVGGQCTTTITPTTIAKHGMSITVLPNLRNGSWQPPSQGQSQLSLTDPQVDLSRLVHLIEDSFGRKLDVSEYLKRVNDRIAGIIIAGEYEGGAILTWETPPGVVDDGSPELRARMVPYLDKFAVLKKKQGSATADLVFKAMVRDCFPSGVCWRSRKDNVVNKWYFERSRGTWKLPDTGWTMFWTTPDLSMDRQTFLDYQSVCRSIQPSWADGKPILD
jgi:amino-acid N-acetyltransferase